MKELEKMVKDVVHGGIGAVATALEVGGEIAKSFVEKGQEVVGSIKQAVDEACEAGKNDPGVDVRSLTKAQRAELRRRLDELDAEEAESTENAEESCDCTANKTAEEAEIKAEFPDVVYEAPAEDDESKI